MRVPRAEPKVLREQPAGVPPARSRLGVRMTPLRIVLAYAAVGAAWILFSDELLFALWGSGPIHERISITKGWLYVLVTAGLLLVLIRRNVAEVTQLGSQMAKVIDGMADAVLLVDGSATVTGANQAAATLLGVPSPSDLVGPYQEFLDRFRARRPDGTAVDLSNSAVWRALAGETAQVEVLLRRADGQDVYASAVLTPVRFRRGGEVSLSVAVIRDVSERRHLETMRDEFLQIAAHEFKTPLAVIKAYVQLLQKRGGSDPAALQVIHRQVDRLARLTQQLLQVSRLRVGGPELRRERYDLAEQLAQVTDRFQHSTASHRLLLEAAPATPVLADRDHIEQVLVNLLDNAARFSPRGGDIQVRLERASGEAVVAVRDHGLGIPREKQAHVFERYQRLHTGSGDDYGGIGVGLGTSREVVTRHGGRMWFESEEGAGSVFYFSLPFLEGRPGAGSR